MELEDCFRADKEHLTHTNNLSTRYQDARKKVAEAKKLVEAADIKRVEAEESLQATMESLTRAEERIWALESEFKQAKREEYENGSKEAQDEIGLQLPGVCNEFYMDAWHDAVAFFRSRRTALTPEPPKLPFPCACPPPPP